MSCPEEKHREIVATGRNNSDQNLQEKIREPHIHHSSEGLLRSNATVETACESLHHGQTPQTKSRSDVS